MEKGNIFNFGNKFLISIIFLSLLIGVIANGLVLGQVFAKGYNSQNDGDTERIEVYPHSYKKSASNSPFHSDKTLSLKLQEQKQENTDLNTLPKSKEQKIAEKNYGEQEDDAIIMKGAVYYEEKEEYQRDMKNEDYAYEGKYSKHTSDEEERDSNRDSDIDTSDEEERDSNRDSDIDTSDEEERDSNRDSDIDTSDEEERDSRDFADDSKENHSNIDDKNQSIITEKSNQGFKKIEEEVIENENSRLISEASQKEQISSDILPANINSKNKFHEHEILIANAGLDQSISKEERIVLDASNSFSKDNSITGFNWELIGDSIIEIDPSNLEVYTIDVPNHMKGKTLEFQLTVTNDDGLTDSDTVKVLINDEQDDDNDEQDDDNDEQDDDNDEQDDKEIK
jgi:hypothetical protein